MSSGGSSYSSSNVSDDSDLDDIPLIMPEDKPVHRLPPAFASLALPSMQQAGPDRSPVRFGQAATSMSHGDAVNAALSTPDPCEPLPSSRTSRRPAGPSLRLPIELPASQQQGSGLAALPKPIPKLSLPATKAAEQAPLPTHRESRGTPDMAQHAPLLQSNSSQSSATWSTQGTGTPLVRVSLLSTGLFIRDTSQQGNSNGTEHLRQLVLQGCMQELKMEPERIRMYQVQELQPAGVASSELHVAVQFEGSEFSMRGMEELLARNNSLKEERKTAENRCDVMYNDIKALNAEKAQLLVQNTQQTEQLCAERARSAALEAEIEQLRAQQRGNDERFNRLQGTIKELKRDFQRTLNSPVFGAGTAP